ncbi:lipid-binding SYLF domain-containing protein [Campylobacter hyointestinalis]|uniref:Lipid-binding SYLF domain-containing protein n=2 Tax=Campylobacter hyointestinalis TaxID=198 RepID=A0AAV6EFC6_CAMHY|nr:lipid-binding SYLF domain-containing protein [Campylobacter hyointestinalis]KAB0613121.1 lipid-binding SYLF domain-containing protein [Campylobacter hyointestinalis subsp. lawsonii]QKF69290.1 putative lipid-binding protein (SYLF/DUF500 domain) [Campylobacter hyointestinalis subsp. lawsonii]RAZ22937.1 hypothetical protein CHL9752_08240 [Campylobacter hyointestinalis subsp. lawsonii]RAZ27490.1 hypothetical protein CHLT_07595 [Campylobacter hyointestinalis subsp. lawsonii]RAZ38613.1 hypothetic
MKKIFLILALFCSFVFCDDELLLDSANAYKVVLKANSSIPVSSLVEKSSAVVILPKFVKVGFIIGGSIGKGVMMVKNADSWMPIGVKMGGGSLGFQIGYEDSYLVIFVLKNSIVQDIKDAKFTISADASASFNNVGANAGKLSDFTFSDDIYAYSNNSGYFAGAKLGGYAISVDKKIKFDTNSYGFNALIEALNVSF